jgi:hypothetical protein
VPLARLLFQLQERTIQPSHRRFAKTPEHFPFAGAVPKIAPSSTHGPSAADRHVNDYENGWREGVLATDVQDV